MSRSTRCRHRSSRRAAPPFWVNILFKEVQPGIVPVIITITSAIVIMIVVMIVVIIVTIIAIITSTIVIIIVVIMMNISTNNTIGIGKRGKGREGIRRRETRSKRYRYRADSMVCTSILSSYPIVSIHQKVSIVSCSWYTLHNS